VKNQKISLPEIFTWLRKMVFLGSILDNNTEASRNSLQQFTSIANIKMTICYFVANLT